MTPENRKNKDIRELVILLAQAKDWIERVDKKIQKIVYRETQARKDD